eukprot:jgi/Ulvmu1/11230/UM073_0002.1
MNRMINFDSKVANLHESASGSSTETAVGFGLSTTGHVMREAKDENAASREHMRRGASRGVATLVAHEKDSVSVAAGSSRSIKAPHTPRGKGASSTKREDPDVITGMRLALTDQDLDYKWKKYGRKRIVGKSTQKGEENQTDEPEAEAVNEGCTKWKAMDAHVKQNTHKRSYLRCSQAEAGCPAKRHVQMVDAGGQYLITCLNRHTCDAKLAQLPRLKPKCPAAPRAHMPKTPKSSRPSQESPASAETPFATPGTSLPPPGCPPGMPSPGCFADFKQVQPSIPDRPASAVSMTCQQVVPLQPVVPPASAPTPAPAETPRQRTLRQATPKRRRFQDMVDGDALDSLDDLAPVQKRAAVRRTARTPRAAPPAISPPQGGQALAFDTGHARTPAPAPAPFTNTAATATAAAAAVLDITNLALLAAVAASLHVDAAIDLMQH